MSGSDPGPAGESGGIVGYGASVLLESSGRYEAVDLASASYIAGVRLLGTFAGRVEFPDPVDLRRWTFLGMGRMPRKTKKAIRKFWGDRKMGRRDCRRVRSIFGSRWELPW